MPSLLVRIPALCRRLPLVLALLLVASCQPPLTVQLAAQPAALARPAAAVPPASSGGATGTPRPTATSGAETATPFPAASPTPLPPATEPPSRIVAPSIGLDATVVQVSWIRSGEGQGAEWQIADNAAGFHEGSALPGMPGNTVISGHHNIKGKVFARIHELEPGAEVDLYVHDQIYRYVVSDSFIVPERGVPEQQRLQNARWIAATDDERLTLVTCWPADDNSHRVIVVARPLVP